MDPLRRLERAIVKGDIKSAPAITRRCLQDGLSPQAVIADGILKGLDTVGRKWKAYEYFIPNVLVSAMATKLCLDALRPALKPAGGARRPPKALAGTVHGDVHDIGKNIVIMFMEASGIAVVDLGIDVSPDRFVKAARREKPDLLLLSCLYTVTMHAMEDSIIALQKAGLKSRLKIIVGGAPITPEFAQHIGADGYGADAVDGVRQARELLNG